jgi:hypothetical protein
MGVMIRRNALVVKHYLPLIFKAFCLSAFRALRMVDHHRPVFLAASEIDFPERTSFKAYSVCADLLAPIHFLLDNYPSIMR